MVKTFEVVYDDFSGGHFVGGVSTHQPKNTFVGANMGACPNDGMLMPLRDDLALTSSLTAADDFSNCSAVLQLDTTFGSSSFSGGFSWAGDTSVYWAGYASAIAPPLTVTSTALGTDVNRFSVPVYFPPTNEIIYLTASTTIYRVTPGPTPTVNSTTTPVQFREVIAWGEFVFGDTGTGKLYYSNPSTAATWTSTDFIAIPHTKDRNFYSNKMVLHQGSLWISTDSGWWVASGIPNSTLSLRQVTTVANGSWPQSIDTSIVSTAEEASRISPISGGALGPLFRELVGNRDRPLNFAANDTVTRYPSALDQLVRVGNYIVGYTDNASAFDDEGGEVGVVGLTLWVLDVRTGVWTRRLITRTSSDGQWLGTSLQSASDLLVWRDANPDALYGLWIGQPDLFLNADGTYPSATVSLAEYDHRVPFAVKEIICEVDYGRAALDTDDGLVAEPDPGEERTIEVSIKTSGVPIEYGEDISLARSQTSTMTEVMPSFGQTGANYTSRRSWVRFNPTDGSDTYTATPVVTLQGLKLRRLIMKCQEIG